LVESLQYGKEDLESLKFPNGLQSTILIDKNEQIVDRQMNLSIEENAGQHNFTLTTKNVPYGKDKVWKEFVLEDSLDSEEVLSLKYTNDVQNEKDGSLENMEISLANFSEELAFSMTSQFKGSGGKQEVQREFQFVSDTYGYYDIPQAFSGEITHISDVKGKSSDNQLAVTLNIEDEYDAGSLTLNIDSATELIDKVELPNLNADSNDGLNILDITEDEMYRISTEVGLKLYSLAEKFGIPLEDYYY
jgi:hypothetical protein